MKYNIGWGLTNVCNMKCKFCYSKKVRVESESELTINEWKKFINENYMYIDSINYGTGENGSLSIVGVNISKKLLNLCKLAVIFSLLIF